MQRPKGKMLIYWGCGEHAAAAPITIDFATIGQGRMPNLPTINVNVGTPPDARRYATIGLWPNEKTRTTVGVSQVPANGSLVGEHTIRGNYSPEIKFALAAGQDFMPPLTLTSTAKSPGGGRQLRWNAVTGATGYFAQVMGAQGQGETMVMWSSSGTAASFGAMLDYVPPAEVRRLIASRVVMPPTQTECIVPSEVIQAAPMAMLMMIAYGDEVNVANPPRPSSPRTPWNIEWSTKVRFKSSTTQLLGMPGM